MVGTDSERGETECKGHMTHTLPQETPSLPSPETVMYCLQQYKDRPRPAVARAVRGYPRDSSREYIPLVAHHDRPQTDLYTLPSHRAMA